MGESFVQLEDVMKAAKAENVLHFLIHIAYSDRAAMLFAVFLELHEESKARGTDVFQVSKS